LRWRRSNSIGQPGSGKLPDILAAVGVVVAYAFLWFYFSKATFEWNAVATLAVWVMTLFIQRSNRRDTLALHAKLDELLRVDTDTHSELTP
jgi:low affinity Fe/Cu permease